ncbi:hypothetical protein SLS64_014118 [Diaporthe eres]|uniref:Ankyrin repeat protein n=1 Tax=Diaporthe eres TaxID=83184 RepID=A0ABR1NLN3_DIAER
MALKGAWPGEEKVRKQRDAITLLKRLMCAGADVNARAENGTTPLISAAALTFPAAIRGLFEGKPDVRAKDDDGQSTLHMAVASGVSCFPGASLSSALATIQFLLDNGADPSQQSADRSGPPLFQGYCFTGGTIGADPREFSSDPTRDGEPSAMASIASLLIKRGADPNIYLDYPRDRGGNLEEQIANLSGHSLVVAAFYKGEFDALDSLVACGTLITYQDYLLMMRSLIDEHFRSTGSKSNAVQSLFRILNGPCLHLERPGDRKSIMDAWTELLLVSVGDRPGLVRVLAPHFSVTDKLAPGGRTALHLLGKLFQKRSESKAEFRHRIEGLVADLIRCGVGRQIDQPDNDGESPLYFAVARRWNFTVARALVRAGASLHCEPVRRDGTTVDSPLRAAIKDYSTASVFKLADGMLDAFHSKWHRDIDRYCGNAGLLKNLILHFRDNRFDDPVRIAARTNKLMVKLIDLGVDVNESDEDGNTPLHMLIELLYPPHKCSKGIKTSQSSKGVSYSPTDPPKPAIPDIDSVLDIPRESYMLMQGNNSLYPSDSDFEDDSSNENNTDDQDDSPDEHSSSDDEDHTDDESNEGDDHSLHGDFPSSGSLRVMARKGYQGHIPKQKPSGLAKRSRARELDRADAWILSFYILLSETKEVSLTMKNNAGKTPLDLIRGLKACRIKECAKAYRRIINPLSRFDPSDPLSSGLLNRLTGSSVLPKKGRPFFFIYDRNGCYLVVPHREGERRVERQDRSRDQWSWVPFW